MKTDNNVKVLDELHKGCCMGIDALKYILDKVDNKEFKDLLNKQYESYEKLEDKIDDIYSEYSNESPDETTTMNKMMTWYGIQMSTMKDSTTSKLAELLVQGTDMGIIEGRKLLNHKDMDKKIEKLVNKYINMQEKYIEDLKKFL